MTYKRNVDVSILREIEFPQLAKLDVALSQEILNIDFRRIVRHGLLKFIEISLIPNWTDESNASGIVLDALEVRIR